ncbi:MAG: hypothetical protein AAF358_01095 [Pseudomonadota bacterium]
MNLLEEAVPKFSVVGVLAGAIVGSMILAGAFASLVIWLDALTPGNADSNPLNAYLLAPFVAMGAAGVILVVCGMLHRFTAWKLSAAQAFLVTVSFCTSPLALTGFWPFIVLTLAFNPVVLYVASVGGVLD